MATLAASAMSTEQYDLLPFVWTCFERAVNGCGLTASQIQGATSAENLATTVEGLSVSPDIEPLRNRCAKGIRIGGLNSFYDDTAVQAWTGLASVETTLQAYRQDLVAGRSYGLFG